jgi:hypothetical protein
MSQAQVNFVRQQGFGDASARTCDRQYPGLMFQPRAIGVIALVGVLLQAPWLFLGLSAVLGWNVAVPALNPFDRLYDALVGARKGLPPLPAAPAPRRFAQGVAATFTLIIGVSLLGVGVWRGCSGVPALALGALIFGRFCLGSYLYHLATGKATRPAHATLEPGRVRGRRRDSLADENASSPPPRRAPRDAR